MGLLGGVGGVRRNLGPLGAIGSAGGIRVHCRAGREYRYQGDSRDIHGIRGLLWGVGGVKGHWRAIGGLRDCWGVKGVRGAWGLAGSVGTQGPAGVLGALGAPRWCRGVKRNLGPLGPSGV